MTSPPDRRLPPPAVGQPHGEAVDALKRALRVQALAARRAAHATIGDTAGARLARHAVAAFAGAEAGVVAGYWPMAEELDIRPVLMALAERGWVAALPVVVARDAPLVFRPWAPGTPLEAGRHGTFHPPATAGEVEPRLVLVPLLAFDRRGGRLGYGGGYYDRTLAALRNRGQIIAVGVGYAAQELPALPSGQHDQGLDWLLTEDAAWEVAP